MGHKQSNQIQGRPIWDLWLFLGFGSSEHPLPIIRYSPNSPSLVHLLENSLISQTLDYLRKLSSSPIIVSSSGVPTSQKQPEYFCKSSWKDNYLPRCQICLISLILAIDNKLNQALKQNMIFIAYNLNLFIQDNLFKFVVYGLQNLWVRMIRTCNFRMWESCIWCLCRHPLHHASLKFRGSPESSHSSFSSFAVHNRSCLPNSLHLLIFTSFVLEHVEDWQNLTVVGYQSFTYHIASKHQFLNFLQSCAHHLMVFCWEGL